MSSVFFDKSFLVASSVHFLILERNIFFFLSTSLTSVIIELYIAIKVFLYSTDFLLHLGLEHQS